MAEQHQLLWQRVRHALAAHQALPPGHPTPREIADHARKLFGTDVVTRFVNEYYLERRFGGGESKLSHEQAEALVAIIEELGPPSGSPVQPPSRPARSPSHQAGQQGRPGAARRIHVQTDTQEAEAYGVEEAAAEREAALAAERDRLGREAAARARAEEEQRRLEAAETARQEAERRARNERAQAEEADRQRQAAEEAGRVEAERTATLVDRAVALMEQRQPGEAIVLLEERIALSAGDVDAWVQLGYALTDTNDHEAAIKAFATATRLEAHNEEAWYWLGWTLSKLGDRDGAIRAYRRAAELDPNEAETWTKLGLEYLGERDWARAEDAFRRALGVNPNHAAANDGLSRALDARRPADPIDVVTVRTPARPKPARRSYGRMTIGDALAVAIFSPLLGMVTFPLTMGLLLGLTAVGLNPYRRLVHGSEDPPFEILAMILWHPAVIFGTIMVTRFDSALPYLGYFALFSVVNAVADLLIVGVATMINPVATPNLSAIRALVPTAIYAWLAWKLDIGRTRSKPSHE